jgi:hypothetical protein
MKMIRNWRLGVAVILTLAVALPALAAPNFAGEWKLNLSKSDFGQMPPPNSRVDRISHEGVNLSVVSKQSREQGDFTSESKYTTDGKECTNEILGNQSKSTLKWEGDTLVIATKGKFQDNEFTVVSKWTLSPDGKTLTLNQHFSSSMGEGDSKIVLEKQLLVSG